MKVMKTSSKLLIGLVAIFIIMSLSACGAKEIETLSKSVDDLEGEVEELEQTISELETSNQELTDDKEQLTEENKKLDEELTALKKTNEELETSNKTLQGKVDEAGPWFELSEIERQEKEAELQRQKEEEEQARLAEEKKGYNTGITFEQLARTPDDYNGKKVKFSGKVLQVIEGTDEIKLRIAVNNDYDKVILVGYDPDIVDMRVLEDDKITIMGESVGLYSYESTGGATITIPAIVVDIIEFN